MVFGSIRCQPIATKISSHPTTKKMIEVAEHIIYTIEEYKLIAILAERPKAEIQLGNNIS